MFYLNYIQPSTLYQRIIVGIRFAIYPLNIGALLFSVLSPENSCQHVATLMMSRQSWCVLPIYASIKPFHTPRCHCYKRVFIINPITATINTESIQSIFADVIVFPSHISTSKNQNVSQLQPEKHPEPSFTRSNLP